MLYHSLMPPMLYTSPGRPALQHGFDATAVVLDIQPVADVPAIAVDRDRLALERIQYRQRNQFFGKLVGAVIIGTVGGQHRQAVGVVIGTHQVIG